MKKLIILLIAVLFSANLFSQVPEKLSYQAVIRNSSNKLVANSNIGMQISILKDSPSGTAVYVERQFPSTNENGLVTLEIGNGSVVSGSFRTIDWSTNLYYIKTETDLNGGANYTITGTSQILSVPYALHAKTAESISGTVAETDPVFGASAAQGITSTNISNWNSAYGWGNHSGLYAPLAHVGATGNAHGVATTTDNGFMSATDKIKLDGLGSGGEMTYPGAGIAVSTGSAWGTSIMNNSENWNTAYSWGNHATAGYLKSESDTTLWKKKNNNIYFNSGNVGIGLVNPTNKLEVAGSLVAENVWANNGGGASFLTSYGVGDEYIYSCLMLGDKSTNKSWSLQHRKIASELNNLSIEYNNGSINTPMFSIKPNGNVGIGTTNPTSRLNLEGNSASTFTSEPNSVGLKIRNTQFDEATIGSGFIEHDGAGRLNIGTTRSGGGGIRFFTHNGTSIATRVKINEIGNVGIGTENPTRTLEVKGGVLVSNDGYSWIECAGGGDDYCYSGLALSNPGISTWSIRHKKYPTQLDYFALEYEATGAWHQMLVVDPNGNVGIGTADGANQPKAKLQVTGGDVYIENIGSGVIMKSPNGNCWRVTIDNSGNLVRTQITCP